MYTCVFCDAPAKYISPRKEVGNLCQSCHEDMLIETFQTDKYEEAITEQETGNIQTLRDHIVDLTARNTQLEETIKTTINIAAAMVNNIDRGINDGNNRCIWDIKNILEKGLRENKKRY